MFFPRTVTLNYVVAQCAGSLAGVAGFTIGRNQVGEGLAHLRRTNAAALQAWTALAAILSLAYILAPFDPVLSAHDVRLRLTSLMPGLWQFPFSGRPALLRGLLWLAGGAAVVPVGMALWFSCMALRTRARPLAIAWRIGLAVLASWAASMLILSTTPTVFTLPTRVAGMALGAVLLGSVTPLRLIRIRLFLLRMKFPLALVYTLAVLAVCNVLTDEWRTPAQAWAAIDTRFFLPLWTHYIVTKAQALKSVAVHLGLYAPIGVLLWLGIPPRTTLSRRRQAAAALIGFTFALVVEVGRWFKPGLAPDFNNAVFGGIAAWATLKMLPRIWLMLEDLALLNSTMR